MYMYQGTYMYMYILSQYEGGFQALASAADDRQPQTNAEKPRQNQTGAGSDASWGDHVQRDDGQAGVESPLPLYCNHLRVRPRYFVGRLYI